MANSVITLKHIAAEAGTTIATVSMALRGSPKISPARRAAILEIAGRLGYRRNAHVSALMRHIRQSRDDLPNKAAIALVLAHSLRDARKRYVFLERRFRGMEARIEERGYRPDYFWYNDPEVTHVQLQKILTARGIRGVVLAFFGEYESVIETDWANFAVATHSDVPLRPGAIHSDPVPRTAIHRVVEDYFANTVTAMTHLWQDGCRRIGLAHQCHQGRSARFRILAAYHEFLFQAMGAREKIPTVHIPKAEGWTEQAFMKWFRREKLDAVLTFDFGDVPLWLRAAGINIPEDVSLAVLNRCPSAPEFSGVDPEPERLGETLVDLVIEQLENNEVGLPKTPKMLTIPGLWVKGSTTRR